MILLHTFKSTVWKVRNPAPCHGRVTLRHHTSDAHSNMVVHAVSHLIPYSFKCLMSSGKVQVET